MVFSFYNAGAFISQTIGTEKQVTAGTIYTAAADGAFKIEGVAIPATTTTIILSIYSIAGTGFASWPIGSYLELDGLMLNKAATLFPYFDGSTTDTADFAYGWVGTADASVSNRMLVSVVVGGQNYVANPSVETDTTAWVAVPGTGGTAALTSAAPSTTTAFGTKVLKQTWSVASTAASGAGPYFDYETGVVGITVGDVLSTAFYHVKSSINNRLRTKIEFRTAAGIFISQVLGTEFQATAGTIYSAATTPELKIENVTVPATTGRFRIYLSSVAGTGYQNWSAGSYVEVDGVMLNAGVTVLPYFDGSTPDTASFDYQWLGTANLSAAIRVNTTSLTFAATPQGQTMTISAGGAVAQIAERANIRNGTHVLSWPGTALGRVYTVGTTAPAYAASPVVVTLDGTNDVIMEFSGGTLSVGDTGVKLEFGDTASPFSLEPLSIEQHRCMFYFQVLASGGSEYFGFGQAYTTTLGFGFIKFAVPMRSIPTFTRSAATDFATFTAAGADVVLSALTFQEASVRSVRFNATTAAVLSVGQAMQMHGITANARIYADSEL